MIVPGLAVLCRGASFGPLPARVAASCDDGRWWVTVCLRGYHTPLAFAAADLSPLDGTDGLCAECARIPVPAPPPLGVYCR